ncbi:efflux pump, RND family, membrane fusion protein [Syntrophotalea carbinolica DSM 2380]|uniref:Efflux pump, RND family, membrane fusion protein n=1 Tax=Syntrophotalea carbinolica (strain DSM 2380 / NBRC 103641 / GraBd1) TaxID=338963 RepID=Q3A7L9_SYNC1|nr:efflux RND transporter periplasmic adaptor subunit [Syntrophotalea carbinolica]ABA87625.1 efflux pump, RND family, membrane fusion protein [Syntrophotalea carbinolica DSM 2380]
MKRWLPEKLMTTVKVLLIVCGGYYLLMLGFGFAAQPDGPPPAALQTGKVSRGSMEVTVACTGSLKAVGTVEVGTEVSGTIGKVLVDYNDRVRKGQVLAELDLELFKNAVDEAEANQMGAEALYRQALSEYRRNQPLHQQGHLSDQEFLEYRTALATTGADLQSSKATLAKARTNLRKARILSPIDGTVIEREIEVGQTVAASYSTPTLFILAEDLARMEIEADVDESDIGLIRKGQKVRFTVQAYPDRQFHGEVTQIRLNPTEESNVVTYTVVVAALNDGGLLLPGMTATADFIVDVEDDALLVPNAALQFAARRHPSAKDAAVLVLEDGGRLRRLAVVSGLSDGVQTTVLTEGLTEGMVVATGEASSEERSGGSLFSRLMPHPRHGPKPEGRP